MWTFRHLLVLSLAVALAVAVDYDEQLERDEIIEAVNSKNFTWKAGRNFDASMSKEYVKKLLGAKRRPGGSLLPAYVDDGEDLELPTSFDSRKKWRKCKSLHQVRDQGACASSWAVAAASAFTDRLCIASKMKFNGHLSAENLLSCCHYCGDGCGGGFPDSAWLYLQTTGIVTGGDYKSKAGCQPYTLPACEHHVNGKRKNCSPFGEDMPKSALIGDMPTPSCQSTCYNKKYKKSYSKDLHKVKIAFSTKSIEQTQKEIFKHGPVETTLDVYEDFLSYKQGVYMYRYGDYLGPQSVKIIGWGVEEGIQYWLVANSWNSDWGDKGFFKIASGFNMCGIESDINVGYPQV